MLPGSVMWATHAGTRIVPICAEEDRAVVHWDLRTVELAPDHCDGLDHVLGLVGSGSEVRRERPRPDSKPRRNERPTRDTRGGCSTTATRIAISSVRGTVHVTYDYWLSLIGSVAALVGGIEGLNKNKPYRNQIEPYYFMLAAHVAQFGHPPGEDPAKFRPITPFDGSHRNGLPFRRPAKKLWRLAVEVAEGIRRGAFAGGGGAYWRKRGGIADRYRGSHYLIDLPSTP